jgi:hypothetical protein
MNKALQYARQRRDHAYELYIQYSKPNILNKDATTAIANEQYFMGRWHEALDHVWQLEQLMQRERANAA